MNCKEVDERLSDYLDGTLGEAPLREVEAHLSSCARCLENSKELSKTINAVGSLPEVDVPPGFSERVMARVREEAEKEPLWERLFLPVRIKIPLHATALLVVIGLAVYLYEANLPVQRELARPVPSDSLPSSAEELSKAKKDNQPETEALRPDRFAGGASGEARGSLRSLPEKMQENLEAKAASPQGVGQATAGAEAYEIVLTPAEPLEGNGDLADKVNELVKKVGGAYLKPAERSKKIGSSSRSEAEAVWLGIPADRYGQFRDELSSLGKIAPETKRSSSDALLPQSKSFRLLPVKLTILPAGRSDKTSTCNQPAGADLPPETGRKYPPKFMEPFQRSVV
jgi:hypothetical protein